MISWGTKLHLSLEVVWKWCQNELYGHHCLKSSHMFLLIIWHLSFHLGMPQLHKGSDNLLHAKCNCDFTHLAPILWIYFSLFLCFCLQYLLKKPSYNLCLTLYPYSGKCSRVTTWKQLLDVLFNFVTARSFASKHLYISCNL